MKPQISILLYCMGSLQEFSKNIVFVSHHHQYILDTKCQLYNQDYKIEAKLMPSQISSLN